MRTNLYTSLFLLSCTISLMHPAASLQPSSQDLTLTWGLSARQGKRPSMEDAHAHKQPFISHSNGFFAIYDGHGGKPVAQYAAGTAPVDIPSIHALVADETGPFADRLTKGIQAFEKETKLHQTVGLGKRLKDHSGTTAVIGLFEQLDTAQPKLDLAWVGDSRAVLVNNNGSVAYATTDHDFENPAELERLKNRDALDKIHFYGVKRIAGLAMPRSLGDHHIKLQAGPGVIIGEPEIQTMPLKDNHALLILACDGLWDVMSNEEAAQIATQALRSDSFTDVKKINASEKMEDLGSDALMHKVAQTLRDIALERGSSDNISVLVVGLNWHGTPVSSALKQHTSVQPAQSDATISVCEKQKLRTRLREIAHKRNAVQKTGLTDKILTVINNLIREIGIRIAQPAISTQEHGEISLHLDMLEQALAILNAQQTEPGYVTM